MRNLNHRQQILLILYLLLLNNIFAQEFVYDKNVNKKVDQFINMQMEKFRIPGVSLSVVKDNKIFYSKGYGISDELGRTVTPKTSFLLASVSKSFTALAIMQLVESGLIELDAPVKKYIPRFHTLDDSLSNLITIRQLLNQTSGFSNYTGKVANLNDDMDGRALEKYVRSLSETDLVNIPGERCEYSNTNFGILGYVIEAISGLTIEEYLQKKIFDPLEMKHTFASKSMGVKSHLSMGFYPFFNRNLTINNYMPYSRTIIPWGGIFSSAEDLSNYLIALLNEGEFNNKSIITSSGLAELFKPVCQIDKYNQYAMGWFVQPFFQKYTAIWHDGLWLGYRSFVLMVPEKNFGIVLLMNTNNPSIESIFSSIGWGISDIYFGFNTASISPTEPFIIKNIRLLLALTIFLLLGISLWFLFKWKIYNRKSLFYDQSTKKKYLKLFLPYSLEILMVIYLIEIMLPQNNTNLLMTIRFAPDIGLMLLVILFLTVIIGSLRTFFVLLRILNCNQELKLIKNYSKNIY